MSNLNFSSALEFLKNGEKVRRVGWNGKGMYLFILRGSIIELAIATFYSDCSALPVCDAIYMKTADNKLVPWLASQTDILANDWEVFI
jgi:hypothetical protein